jgi:outer membrane protein OmpA-like peptidoglycan-associated protein
MMRRLIDATVAAVFGGGLVLTCASCSTLSSGQPALPTKPSVQQTKRWEQVSFGREARFAVCMEPACPRVTPKTIAQAPEASVAAAVRPDPPPVPLRSATLGTDAISAQRTDNAPTQPVRASFEARSVVITFPSGSAQLTDEGRARIRDAIEAAKRADRIVITGRTDSMGGDSVNKSLALARAIAVRDHFRVLAPDLPATFSIDAKGRCCFVASNDHEPGRSKNRRVEVVFVRHGGA